METYYRPARRQSGLTQNQLYYAFTLVLVFLAVGLADATNPGLKLRISQKGLNYGATVAIDQLSTKVSGQTIPDQSGEAHVAIGKIKYTVSNMRVTGFSKPSTTVTLSGSGLNWAVSGVSASIHGDWRYEYKKGWVKVKDHGSFDVDASASIRLSVTLGKAPTGHPTISATSCSSDVSGVKVKLHGGASWLYNLFSGNIADALKDQLKKILCKSVNDLVDSNANQALAKMKIEVPLNKFGVLDYSLTQSPKFTTSDIESFHKGEIFWAGDKTDAPIDDPALADPPLDGMVTFLLSDYVLNTAGYVLQKHNILRYNLTRKDLKSNPDILNTSCSGFGLLNPCIGMLIPQLGKVYPHSFVEIYLETFESPTLKIDTSGVTGQFVGEAVFSVRTEDGSKHPAFTLLLNVTAAVDVKLEDQIIKAEVTNLTPKFKITDSKIGKIPDVSIKFLFSIIDAFVKTQLKEIGEKGMPLPKIDNVAYVNPKITLIKDGISFATDVKYIPSTLFFKPRSH